MSDVRSRGPATAGGLIWVGWLLIIACALVRAQAALVPFPYWDVDPTMFDGPILGIGPTGSMLIDVLMMLGAGIALLGHALRNRGFLRVHLAATILVAAGAAGACLHAWVLPGGTIEDLRISATWIAAIMAGLAIFHICEQERLRRLTFAVGIGFIVMLAAKGALEVFVEHPMTVERFRVDQEAFLAAQGWPPDSAAARNFARRVNQPEATGWFGMANVYASFAAAGFIALLGLAFIAWREARIRGTLPDGWAGLLTFGAAAGAAAVAMAGGKGGYAAAGMGVGILAFGGIARWWMDARAASDLQPLNAHRARAAQLGGLFAIGLIGAALAAVGLRGLIGERIGELSLLFRWFYMQGAARVYVENPLFGVGPDGFKDAYQLAKPPLSPEEVSSPHSVLLDWTVTLGLAGLAWCAAWLTWVWMAGITGARGLLTNMPAASKLAPNTGMRGSFDSVEERADARVVLLLAAGTMLVGAWLEQPGLTVESAAMRMIGAAGWLGVGLAALAVMRVASWWWIGMAAAIVLAVHAQIEVTPVWPGSAALFMILIASIAAPAGQTNPAQGAVAARSRPARRATRFLPAAIALAMALAWPWLGQAPITRWHGDLRAAADAVQPIAEVRQRINRLVEMGGGGLDGDTMPRIAADVARRLGQRPAQDQRTFERQMNELLARSAAEAQGHLESAHARAPGHMQTTEALVRIMRLRAMAEWNLERGTRAREFAREAEDVARAHAEAYPSAAAMGLLGNVLAERYDLERTPDLLEGAIAAWTRAAELDPHGLTFPWRIYRVLERHGMAKGERGIGWARRVLELDEQLRLDEIKRLTEAERDRVAAALRQAGERP